MQLRRADVLRGAVALLDDEGLDGLTMRKLGARLNVRAGALYWHFANKQALLEAVADQLVAGVTDRPLTGPWDQQLITLAGDLRAALISVRDGARIVAETFVTQPNTTLAGKAVLEILTGAGVPVARAGWVLWALSHYVLGFAIEEQARGRLTPETVRAKLAEGERELGPEVGAALGSVATADPDDRFRYGLELFLDGIRQQLRAAGS